jgi:hypothetical protein
MDYCYKPRTGHDGKGLAFLGNNGAPQDAFPLGRCFGDCDDDSDCYGILKCFQRDGFEAVPGCTGKGKNSTDYCYDPADGPGSLEVVSGTGTTLSRCQGHCDSDSNCADDLACFQQDGTNTFIPGCTGQVTSGTNYCYNPDDFNDLVTIQYESRDSEGLSRCQGDCWSDTECSGDLKCFQRDEFEPVPGCTGGGSSGTNYCYDPADDAVDPVADEHEQDGFRLKMYWKNYKWRGETFDRQHCMECGGGGCEAGDKIFLKPCSSNSTRFNAVVLDDGVGTHLKILGSNLCLDNTKGLLVRAAVCEPMRIRQKFHKLFYLDKFEVQPFKIDSGCLTSDHEPKVNEEIFIEDCAIPRADNSSLWIRY